MTDHDEAAEILEAVRLAQTVLGKTSARDAANDGCRPIWTALDWCETWLAVQLQQDDCGHVTRTRDGNKTRCAECGKNLGYPPSFYGDPRGD